MKITLDANPSNAPCCIRIEAENGQDRLIQTDWDWPGIASSFGWSVQSVQKFWRVGDFDYHAQCGVFGCDQCGEAFYPVELEQGNCPECDGKVEQFKPCEHSSTDGTVDCKECGVKASQFIEAARAWIDDNDGAQVEDPGYFDND